MDKYIFLLMALLFSINLAFSQEKEPKGIIEFEATNHDFGTIREEDGSVTHSFSFKNTGDAPILIGRVKTSCGCTSPGWTQTPILPGNTGFVKATYNPRGRPGSFHKRITVSSNATAPNIMLRIRGHVTPRPKTIGELYPKKMGALWLNKSNVTFSYIKNNRTKAYKILGYNSSDKKISLTFNNLPKYISIDLKKNDFEPKEKFEIPIKFDASLINHWGLKKDNFQVLINGKAVSYNTITTSASIIEDFSSMSSEERKNAPVISTNDVSFDFKEIKQGEKPEKEFKITNKGGSNLIIRKIEATCNCIVTDIDETVISPNQKITLSVIYDSSNKKGRQRNYIDLITNDPNRPIYRIRVLGNVFI